ncbi:hypothetical protein ACV6K4_000095 [Acinetobacter baumannii]|nr:hypothetical protein [Acinetobacter baumannii]EKU6362228.1 hypothetical protein [Acinetobacter baumannii]EKV5731290.1 hypothetical protein [Acinetobacter baumannii]EKW7561014.1 hypothetical protein [Acinetobacter baumannii]EKX2283764.1 hypothetical protein [Acinetobacter baumannii]
MKKYILALGVILTGCSGEPAPEIMGKKFSSMDECLASIRMETQEVLDPLTDKPNHVSGFLGKSGLQFNCELKETATEGTYIDGWYQKKVSQ